MMRILYFTFLSICLATIGKAQTIDSSSVTYGNNTLSVYLEGLLFDADFRGGFGVPSNRAISSVFVEQSNDSIVLNFYFLPCGPLIQIVPYDTLYEQSLSLSSGLKEVVVYAIDTIVPNSNSNCPKNLVYRDTASMQINIPVSLDENLLNEQIKLFPNPTKGSVRFDIEAGLHIEDLQLYNLRGETIRQWTSIPEQLQLSELSKGVYMLKIETNSGLILKRLLIE